ncbi:hypothetical protein CAOG_05148 [Capsaspora owczarzaki ATCC 30864]|uniref:GH18 domain-containing protein n=1 Tax=Capsaspora owczarzaki (strain ATCC 30864) TaxID=595528 RepID=A0A0D2WRI5_CAPO3|nr:hypothetical protein CAOG_05148 [Capsaspora owczarzaki ATCC 30864]KJE94515.1 hypothetical protein CAOG_005148 [Capsaspora owczarzaki ATCC 30864]|eukprot:XP_004346833.2 hypothetical protein CAOG_05148 [Capsaspora owczarzaki ATCC 30864]
MPPRSSTKSALVCASILALAMAVQAVAYDASTRPPQRVVFPWMGLERTQENIPQDLATLQAHKDVIPWVSFERFNLGPNGTFVINELTQVGPTLIAEGFGTFPMISSFPDTNPNLEYTREVCANPDPFIADLVFNLLKFNYTGVNVDIEPAGGIGTYQDAVAYAGFLDKLSRALHQHGLTVTVDIASWTPVWNFTLLAETSVDLFVTMDTYTYNQTAWTHLFQKALDAFGPHRLGAGIMTVNADNNQPLSPADIKFRFDAIVAANVNVIGIWCMPIPDQFWPFIDAYMAGTAMPEL